MSARFDQIIRDKLYHKRWTLTLVDPKHRRYLQEYSEDQVHWLPCWLSEETAVEEPS